MNKDLTILPVRITERKNKKWEKLNQTIGLQHPFHLCIIAPPRAGKSNFLVGLIYLPALNFKKKFDRIIWISPTCLNDKTLHNNVTKDDDIIKFCDEEDLENLDEVVQEIINDQQQDDKLETLLILDDCVGHLKTSKLSALSTKYRHHNLSLIICSQSFRALDILQRNCASHWVLFKTHNAKEVEKLNDEFGLNFPSFKKKYQNAVKKRYNFLFIDMEGQCLHNNLTKKVYDKNEEET